MEVSQSFIGPLRLHNNRAMPPRINKHVLRLKDGYSWNLCLTTGVRWWWRILPSRRPDGERRPVNPTYYVMIGSLWSARKELSADESPQKKNDTHVSVLIRSCRSCRFAAISSPQGPISMCTIGLLTVGPERITLWK